MRVSKALMIPLSEGYNLNIVVYLNILCYLKDKQELEKIQMDEWKRKNKIK